MRDCLMQLWKYNSYYVLLCMEKSHGLPSASWGPREAAGAVAVQTRRPENHRASGVSPGPSPKPENPECGCASSSPFLTSLFYSVLAAWMEPVHTSEGDLLCPACGSHADVFRDALTDRPE